MEHFFSDLFAGRDRFALDVIVDTERTPAELIAHIARIVCDPQRSRRRLYLLGREDGADPCMTLPMWAFFGGGGGAPASGAGATMMTRVKRLLISGVRISNEASGGGSRHDIGYTEFTAHVAGQWRHDNASSNNLMEGFEGMLRTLLRERSPMMSNLLPEGIPANHRNVIIVSDRMLQNTFAALAGCRDVRVCNPGKDDVISIISGRSRSSVSSGSSGSPPPPPRRSAHSAHSSSTHASAHTSATTTSAKRASTTTTFFPVGKGGTGGKGDVERRAPREAWGYDYKYDTTSDSDTSDCEETHVSEIVAETVPEIFQMPKKENCQAVGAAAAATGTAADTSVWDLPDGDDWEWTRWRQPTTTHSVADAMRPVSVSESENE